jgi:S-layer homology domain
VSGVALPGMRGHVNRFSGPAGPVYTLPDASAAFGDIPSGATVGCSATQDCYNVGVSGARPATHWDGLMEEAVDDAVLGQVKLWDLHVGDSFTDVSRASPFYRFIETLLHNGATGGCTATEYCPTALTTRDIMAGFVLVAKEGAGYVPPACATPPIFADVPGNNPFCRFVEELFRRGVVAGCAPNAYCPADPATREQMAVFVLRTLDGGLNPPACTTPMFADVPASSPFCRWIEELARRGVVNGCAPTLYCPTGPVTREQMAVFLAVTFGLKLYG